MNDIEYIREAVALTDGWKMIDELDLMTAPFGVVQCIESMAQGYKDALAAQLVRQVDALKKPDMRTVYFMMNGAGDAMVHDMTKMDYEIREEGPDRTMNTIKAIIDSGKLK